MGRGILPNIKSDQYNYKTKKDNKTQILTDENGLLQILRKLFNNFVVFHVNFGLIKG